VIIVFQDLLIIFLQNISYLIDSHLNKDIKRAQKKSEVYFDEIMALRVMNNMFLFFAELFPSTWIPLTSLYALQ